MSNTLTPERALPSPFSPQRSRRDSVTSEQAARPTGTNMLQIRNLLNPMGNNQEADPAYSRASTPAYTPNDFTPTPTPGPDTPLTPASTKRQRNGKAAAIVKPTPTKGIVRYKSYECNSDFLCSDPTLRDEIIKQHRNFQVSAEGPGLISQFPKHVPYSSDRKDFSEKTGRDAFEYFSYTFVVPGGDPAKPHRVMWDYQIGLMRVTACFKAFNYAKTVPAKAIKANAGLDELSFSITGGALIAQGYWIPFSCARALCATFCWDIRWALTPVFGPKFVAECLPPNHPGYGRYKIDNAIVQRAALQAQEWKLQASRSATPATPAQQTYGAPYIPQYQPPTSAPTPNPGHAKRPERERSYFKHGSPFSPEAGPSNRGKSSKLDTDDSDVSPKSSPAPTYQSAWTSINERLTPPAAPSNTPVDATDSSMSLLTQPFNSMMAQESAWRGMNGERSASPVSMPTPKRAPTRKRQARKRMAIQQEKEEDEDEQVVVSDSSYKSSPASSDSSVVASSPPSPPPKKARITRRRRRVAPSDEDTSMNDDDAVRARHPETDERDPEVIRAAEILLKMAQGKW